MRNDRRLHPELGGSPLLQQGELDPKPWALALDFMTPTQKWTLPFVISTGGNMGLRPTHGDQKTPSVQQPLSMEASPFPLSPRPERTRTSCHAALDKSACAPFRKGKAHEAHQRHQVTQEIRGSAVEGSAVQRTFLGNVFRRPSCEKRIALAATILLATLISAPASAQQPAPASIPPGAVVLDHVVAVINGSVILESDVQEEMNYAVLQPFSINSARNTPQRALQRLIDRALILQQMKTGGDTIAPPTPEELQEQIHQLRGLIPQCMEYHCETEAGWQAFLSSRGLTEKEVEQHWAQRMLILSFIQSRFGSGVRITPAEIKNYYDQTLVPRLNGVKPPPLANVSSRIEEILLQQRVSSLLLEWLQSLKSEGSVSILDPAYGKVGTTGSGDDSDSGGQS